MVWRKQENRHDDCYSCMVNMKGFNKKSKSIIKYPDLKSAKRPVRHCDEIPVPNPPADMQSSSESEFERRATEGEYYQEEINDNAPKLFSQTQLDDLTRKLNLSKEAAELLASRLNGKNLKKGTTFAWYCHHEKEFTNILVKEILWFIVRMCKA